MFKKKLKKKKITQKRKEKITNKSEMPVSMYVITSRWLHHHVTGFKTLSWAPWSVASRSEKLPSNMYFTAGLADCRMADSFNNGAYKHP